MKIKVNLIGGSWPEHMRGKTVEAEVVGLKSDEHGTWACGSSCNGYEIAADTQLDKEPKEQVVQPTASALGARSSFVDFFGATPSRLSVEWSK